MMNPNEMLRSASFSVRRKSIAHSSKQSHEDCGYTTADESSLDFTVGEEQGEGSSSQQSPCNSPRPRVVRLRGARHVSNLGDDYIQGENQLLIESMRRCMDSLAEQERDIRKGLRAHSDKAKARLECNNTQGAILSMRKVHKLQIDQEKVLAALAYLRTLEVELEECIRESTKTSRGRERLLGRRFSTCSSLCKFSSFEQQVQLIMCDGIEQYDKSALLSDEELLSELNAQTHARCQ